MRMMMRLAWKKSQNKTRSTGIAGKGLDSQLCHYWELNARKRAGSALPRGSWEGVKSIPRRTTYHGTVDGSETPVQGILFCLRIIYNRSPSRSHHDMQGEGSLLLPRTSTGTPLLDLRPEAGYTFAPFGIQIYHCGKCDKKEECHL